MITGWLFDIYPLADKMILWVKSETKLCRIKDQWSPSLYVASDDKEKLKLLAESKNPHIKEARLAEKTERVSDPHSTIVLQITAKNSSYIPRLAKEIQESEVYGVYRLYNVDIPPEQSYLYENNLYPLGKYKISQTWKELSSINETDYTLPEFTKARLRVIPKKHSKIPQMSDKIQSIQINDTILESDSEENMVIDCVRLIEDLDPDFIITDNGDSWDLPYLAYRAEQNKIPERLILGREKIPLARPKNKGTSYFSYGQIHFKPAAAKLLGRIHIDKSNCFIWKNEDSIHGLYEIARTCRLPLQTASRASIGKCMSSVQFYNATRRGLLVPWKPETAEIFKTRTELLIGDRGGLILEPRIGVHENVGELDFVSLFGSIMLTKNISAETINCSCCPDSKSLVPELGYRICRKTGIVPESLQILLEKRQQYTKLIESTSDKERLKIYKERKSALKWILVTSFGYLGFNNAKFGRIDAHMAVCAFARNLLLQAIRITEREGFTVLHGIVDSLWVHRNSATRNDYELLRKKIEAETGFSLALDIYRWIVFLPSKKDRIVPVPNRYFGAKQNDELKLRGIETRRHDTPEFFANCQKKILELFAECKTVSEIRQSLGMADKIKEHYRKHLWNGEIPIDDLAFTNRVTRGTDGHKSNTIQSDVVGQLKWEGRTVVPGQKIRYVISDHSRKTRRVVPVDLVPDKYDAKRYSKLLEECCSSVIDPFLD